MQARQCYSCLSLLHGKREEDKRAVGMFSACFGELDHQRRMFSTKDSMIQDLARRATTTHMLNRVDTDSFSLPT